MRFPTFVAQRNAPFLMLGIVSAELGSNGCAPLDFAVAGPLLAGVAAIADRSESTTSIIVISTSAGVPTVPVPDGGARRDLPAATVLVPPTIREADPPRNGQVPSRLRNPAEHILPATLEPVGVLSPVQALSSERTGQ